MSARNLFFKYYNNKNDASDTVYISKQKNNNRNGNENKNEGGNQDEDGDGNRNKDGKIIFNSENNHENENENENQNKDGEKISNNDSTSYNDIYNTINDTEIDSLFTLENFFLAFYIFLRIIFTITYVAFFPSESSSAQPNISGYKKNDIHSFIESNAINFSSSSEKK